jgi:hypothetical protein
MNKFVKNIVSNEYFILVTSLASVAGIVALIFGSQVISYIALVYFVLYSLFIVWFITKKYFSMKEYKEILNSEHALFLREIGERQHNFFHEYRNHVADMSMLVFDTSNAERVFKVKVETICDNIYDFFSTLLKTEVSVCIKRIVTETLMNSDINTWQVITLARNTKCTGRRSQNDDIPVLVSDNTDFQTILAEGSEQEDWFACTNLENIDIKYRKKGQTFKNSTPYYIEKYKSVIVVPIRIKSEFISASVSSLIPTTPAKRYHVIGFLCIDSLSTFDNKIELFETAVYFLRAFGDSIYTLLELFIIKELTYRIKNH